MIYKKIEKEVIGRINGIDSIYDPLTKNDLLLIGDD